jgi:hypothetical protein
MNPAKPDLLSQSGMEDQPNQPRPPAKASQGAAPILQYHAPQGTGPMWGMPLWGQIMLGAAFFFISMLILGVTIAGVGRLVIVIFIGLALAAGFIQRQLRWPGFVMGILFSLALTLVGVGICAVVVTY